MKIFYSGQSARVLKPGQVIRFHPPAGAYSPLSEQAQYSGKAGMVVYVWNDSMAMVTFGGGRSIVCNSAYLY